MQYISGIGDHIARKLEGAWEVFCSQNPVLPTVKQIDQLKTGDFMQFITSANFLEHRSGPRITTATRPLPAIGELQDTDDQPAESGQYWITKRKRPPKRTHLSQSPKKTTAPDAALSVLSSEQRCSKEDLGPRLAAASVDDMINEIFADIDDSPDQIDAVTESNESSLLYHSPSALARPQVLLIVDNRETGNTKKFRQMCSVFQKKDIYYELRSLSVGDYLWIMRMPDGTEMVLDYIVERKTFDDLWHSIKQKRYDEQKQRLMTIGIPNVVYIVEGSTAPAEAAVEQALVTTHIENRFLVYRTSNMEQTSLLLSKITERLIRRAHEQELVGMSFEDFQKQSKKTQRRSVKDIFLRQLLVCPQMSIQKASLVTDRFPSFASLTRLYSSLPKEQRATALSENVPGISKGASANMAKFFGGV
ncbi:unnamed protein product [Gongylonema pulchrum]|uniref:Crossover junction endonuclease MUS81 n=1 Tax=Gongylonema pulchrum TaxID=637853 RepID=A0A183E182_9BILA|nr:unnamed protein product [Gongylonema pulchrum]